MKKKELIRINRILIFTLLVSTISIIFIPYNYYEVKHFSSDTKIVMDKNFNKQDLNYINQTIKEIKNYWLENQGKIYFVKNVSSYCIKGTNCYAINYKSERKIYIEYSNRTKHIFKEAICHELLHTHLRNSENEEKINLDLTGYKACF